MEIKFERMNSIDELLYFIKGEQEFNWFTHLCLSRLDHQPTINISDQTGQRRYALTIVDNQHAMEIRSFGVFIVPIGR